MDRAKAAAMALERGTLLAKIDTKSAYCIIPVCVGNRPLLGITWCGRFMLMLGCHLGCDQPQKYSMQWQMPWSGASSTKECYL